MNFDLTEEQIQVRDMVREFAQREAAPHIREWDTKQNYSRDIIDKMGEAGILGLPIPEEYGGLGLDYVSLALACAVGTGWWLAPVVGGGDGGLRLAGDDSVVVQPGDTVWSIAGELAGTDQDVRTVVHAIEELNDLEGSVVVPGQVLRLP